jgi:uncharacterized membrane protein YgaE (UPF0421/DUF939 family)
MNPNQYMAVRITQAVKIGVAGALSIYVADLLKLPQNCWAAISAFVVIGTDFGTTGTASRSRLIETVVGAVVGTLFAMFSGGHLFWFGMAAAVTVLVCQSLGLGRRYRIACVTVAIVMIVNNPGSPWHAAVARLLEVALGAVVALAVSALPPKLAATIR